MSHLQKNPQDKKLAAKRIYQQLLLQIYQQLVIH